jgi:hypothetical protein
MATSESKGHHPPDSAGCTPPAVGAACRPRVAGQVAAARRRDRGGGAAAGTWIYPGWGGIVEGDQELFLMGSEVAEKAGP